MPPAMTITSDELPGTAPATRYKMQIIETTFNIDFGGRLPAGAVVLVDETTAIRWYERGVAEIADPDAETYADEQKRVKRDEFLLRARPVAGVFNQAVSRQAQDDPGLARSMREMPRPRRGQRVADPLAGAPVLTTPDPDDE